MATDRPRVLYVAGYTSAVPRPGMSSDAIGYGITSSDVLRDQLASRGFDVVPLDAPTSPPDVAGARSRWVVAAYGAVLDALTQTRPDVILAFHSFAGPWPTEIRRMMLDLGRVVPVVAYTHGSHWDPTDTVRSVSYPRLELADLANLHVLDRLLLVSEYMRTTLRSTIERLDRSIAASIDARAHVVGLPIATSLLERSRTTDRFPRPTIVFNHAPVVSKQPAVFARCAGRLLQRRDLGVVVTRTFTPSDPGGREMLQLAEQFPDRVTLAGDLPIPDYYRILWMADLQVSTATHESLGVATLEAMYARTCCVLPRLGSYPEITGGESAALYEPGEAGLEERVEHLLDRPDERDRIAARLADRARRYAPDVVADGVADVLCDVLSEHGPGTGALPSDPTRAGGPR